MPVAKVLNGKGDHHIVYVDPDMITVNEDVKEASVKDQYPP